MTETLVYDAQSKQRIKDAIYDFLYTPVKKDFHNRIKAITLKNSNLHHNDQSWFSYKGEYHGFSNNPRTIPVNRLKRELHDIMDEYLEDKEDLNNTELPYVMGYITQVLTSSDSLKDYFRLLPQSIHKPIQSLMDTCACRDQNLKDDMVTRIQNKNAVPIELMKKRMVLNLLI